MHVEGLWRATVGVQSQGPGVKMTEVEAHVALVCTSTDDGRLLTGSTNYGQWLTGSLQVVGHAYMALINARNLAHDFDVKLTPCMCSHISLPGWRNGWHTWYLYLSLVRT